MPLVTSATDWRDIPVFIVNRNRFDALRALVEWLRAAGTRRIVILDNDSDYAPLRAWYGALPAGVNALLLPENHGPYVLWRQGVHKVLETPYVLTDSDIVPDDSCPADLIGRLLETLQRYPDAQKVGPALRIDDLPVHYGEADTVFKWESQFWERPVEPGVFAAPIDTTFALYPARGEFSNAPCNLRLGHPYVVRHTPWYVDERALSDEERHYRANTSATFSNWSVAQKDSWVKKSARIAAFDQRARVLHVDGGREYIPGWINASTGVRRDVAFDAASARTHKLALPDDSVDAVHLSHVLEGVRDAQPLFDELWRVAKPDAALHLRVGHGARAGAWRDAAQQRAWHEGSFAALARPNAGHVGMSDWELEGIGLVEDGHGAPQEIVARLRAVKPARARGAMHPAPQCTITPLRDARVDPAFTPVAAALPTVAAPLEAAA